MKVSFDFDGTLDRLDVQRFAKELIDEGHEAWIVTSRIATEPALAKGWYWVERQNEELYRVAEEVGILRERIVFTEHVDKIKYLKGKGFAFHLDDDEWELIAIMEDRDKCRPLNINHFEWEHSCRQILNTDKND